MVLTTNTCVVRIMFRVLSSLLLYTGQCVHGYQDLLKEEGKGTEMYSMLRITDMMI